MRINKKTFVLFLIMFFIFLNLHEINTFGSEILSNDGWVYYQSYENYAPSGMPDFDQRQNNWPGFCGPTSMTNALWYIDSMFSNQSGYPGDGIDDFPLVIDYNAVGEANPGPFTDDHNFNNVNDLNSIWDPNNQIYGNEFVEKIAWYVDTNGCRTRIDHIGTYASDLIKGINNWIADANLNGNIYVDRASSNFGFYDVEPHILNGSCIVFFMGFYNDFHDYLGGHFVTVAGVNTNELKIAVSNPYRDISNPTDNFTLHNDANIVSHDIYTVNTTKPSHHVGRFFWWLEDYHIGVYSIVTYVIVISADNSPPEINITNPKIGCIHFKNNTIQSLLNNTIVIGSNIIETEVVDNLEIDRVEFFIDDALEYCDYTLPYCMNWTEISFSKHKIKVIAYDKSNNFAEDEITVWKIF